MSELDRCRKWLESALEYAGGTHEWSDIVDSVSTGRMQLWPAEKSGAITEILCYPRKKVLHVFLAGGDMIELVNMIEDASRWGVSQGCKSITMSGRKGWQRVLNKDDWSLKAVTMGREL